MDLRKNLGKLARVLALMVVAVRILPDAGVTGGIVSGADERWREHPGTRWFQIGRETQGAEGIRVQLLVVGKDQLRAAREAERAGQQQRWTEGVRVIDREQMRGAPVRPAPAGVGEVLEAAIGRVAVPILRVFRTEQILFAETMVDLDVELVAGAGGRSRGDPVVVDAATRGYSALGTGSSSSAPQDRSGFPRRRPIGTACRSALGFPALA